MYVSVSGDGAGEGPGGWVLRRHEDDGSPAGEPWEVSDLAGEIGRLEREETPRWVWTATASIYPRLLDAGIRVGRCHDLGHTESLLCGHERRAGPVPLAPDTRPPPSPPGRHPHAVQPALFDPAARPGRPATGRDSPRDGSPPTGAPVGRPVAGTPVGHASVGQPVDQALVDRALVDQALVDQVARIAVARRSSPGFALLVAAESAAALAAAEMGHVGLPWRAEIHDEILTELLGPRPVLGGRPPRMQTLAEEIGALLGDPRLNPDSQPGLLRALRRAGLPLRTTRSHELRRIDHPVVAPLLHYKELSRLHSANGWAWREQWVWQGRFHPEYVPGGVVSGRWATRGGGALQIPRAVRAAVVADPGWVLIVADAGQLEPRVLAEISRDERMAAATREGDLYAAVAAQALGRPEARAEAKVALLSAMYGGGTSSPALAALRRRFPTALALLEDAARAGEDGEVVASVLGRTCPPPRPGWQDGPDEVIGPRARARGRFTRNFVVQASAADWANVLVASLRRRLTELATSGNPQHHGRAGGPGRDDGSPPGRPDLVFFQHDEVVVHVPAPSTADAMAAVEAAGAEATRLVLGERGVRIPLRPKAVSSYAEKG